MTPVESLLRQIVDLAEWRTTGPGTTPPCKSDKLTAEQATSLRGAVSKLAREALAKIKEPA